MVALRGGSHHFACIAHVGVFKPPLSQQRYQYVAQALRDAAATDVLDLGCGDGKLLEFLLSGDDPNPTLNPNFDSTSEP